MAENLNQDNKPVMLKLAQLAEKIRGYGHVKLASIEKAENESRLLRQQMQHKPGSAGFVPVGAIGRAGTA